MRVSEQQRYSVASQRIEQAKENNMLALELLSSQKRINNLHDDPIGASEVIKARDRLSSLTAFQKNINFSKGFLEVTESAISNIGNRLMRAHELALGMANDSFGPDSKQATAGEIKEIISEVINMANSRYGARYIFSGFRSRSPSLDQDGVYLGDDGELFLQVSQGYYKKLNTSGRALFEANPEERQLGHFNMIDTLVLLKDGLETNDKDSIHKAIDEISFYLEKTSSYQATVGATCNSLEQAEKHLELNQENEVLALSALEDADIYKATSDFKRTESVLQSSLLAANKLLQPSLFNFMQ